MLSIYIHIPFCLYACSYCNFNFRLIRNYSPDFIQEYSQGLKAEWQEYQKSSRQAVSIRSIYFGGGTPSLLPADTLLNVLAAFPVDPVKVEITLEANPEDLVGKNPDFLRVLRQGGINRLSLGVQSLQDKTLQALGRKHK